MLKRLLGLIIILAFISTTINATDGYFRHGYGVKYSAIGGAGTALALSSMGGAINPASIAYLNNRADFGIALFSPDRKYTVDGNPSGFQGTFGLIPGEVESESKSFPIPYLGGVFKLNEAMALGAMFYANGGMNTDFETATFHDPTSQETGVNLEQMFFGATFAMRFHPKHSFGVTGIFAFQRFAAKGLAAFSAFSSDPASLTGNAVETANGFGFRIGYQGKLSKMVSIGASYQTKISSSEFERYQGLFAEQGDFDIPSTWNAGIAIMPSKKFTIAADVKQIFYSDTKSVNNPMLPNIQTARLGDENGSGFGWEDILVFKIGLMYDINDSWTLMGGYSRSENPIPDSEVMFNILAPGVIENHLTLGFTKAFENKNELSLSFMFAPSSSVTGTNPLEAPGQQTIELEMNQFQVEVGYAFGW